MNNTLQLYIDKEKSIKGYPITSPDRVIDENGVSIKEQLDTIANKNIKWVDIKSFGAVGDGVTDDSEAIKKAFTTPNIDGLEFTPGTYIINITKGSSHARRNFIDKCLVRNVRGINATIKLGNGNCNEVQYTGFQGLFNYNGADIDVYWENMIIDYNWNNNKNNHYVAQYEEVVENGQQLAINGYHIRDMIIKNCTFIDCCGTNVINYRNSNLITRDAIVRIEGNRFDNIGRPAIFNLNGASVDAYHDHSTVSIHLSKDKYNKKVLASIKDNFFFANGHNGVNACECSADVQVFENNYIYNYITAYTPISGVTKTYSSIRNNKIINSAFAINIWSYNIDYKYTEALGFQSLKIEDNDIIVSPFTHMYTPYTYGYDITEDFVNNYIFSFIKFGGALLKSINNFIIRNNNFNYEDLGKNPYYVPTNVYSGCGINLTLLFKNGEMSTLTTTPYIKNLVIEDNCFSNVWRVPIKVTSYPQIDRISVRRNHFERCFLDTAYNNPQASYISVDIHGSTGTAGYQNYDFIKGYNKITDYSNNTFCDIHQYSYGTSLKIYEENNELLNPLFVFKGNSFDKTTSKKYDILSNITNINADI